MAAEFTLTGQVRLDPRWVDDLNTTVVTDSVRVVEALTFANGDGTGEADGYWKDVVTVPGGDAESLDLADLPLNVFGGVGAIAFDTIKVIYIRNTSAVSEVTVALGANVAADLKPGGLLLATAPSAGWAETTLTLTNVDAEAADVEIYLIGVQQ